MSNQRLNVMIDSLYLRTVAASLLYLADQAELNIILRGTVEEVTARKVEIEKLLANSRFNQPHFSFVVEMDFSAMKSAHLWDIQSGMEPNRAFKLSDIQKRSLTEAEAAVVRANENMLTYIKDGKLTPEGEALGVKLHDFGFRGKQQ